MTQEIVRALVNGVWVTEVANQGGGGGGGITEITSTDMSVTITDPTGPTVDLSASDGSSPLTVLHLPLAWDTPHLQAESFAIQGVSPDLRTFSLSPDPGSLFGPGDELVVTGSTGNDGTYTVVSSSGGDVIVSEVVPDPTGDGVASTINQRGVEIGYTPTPGDMLLFTVLNTSETFNGDTATIKVGWPDDQDALASFDGQANSHYDAHLDKTGNSAGSAVGSEALIMRDTTPVTVLVDNSNGIYPDATEGETVLIFVVVNAS